MLSLNQIISQITTLAGAHSQIASSGVGDFAEWQAEERNYPILWVFHEDSVIQDRYITHNIRLICADLVIAGEEGEDTDGHEQEVLSDTQLILLDFLAYFNNQYSQTYDIVRSATIEPFTESYRDRVAGNSVVIQIRQTFEWDKCSIPQSGAVIPPTVDGLTLYDFTDPTVFARLTAQQISDLEAELCGIPAPSTISVNGVDVQDVACGDTYNVEVQDTAGNVVGTSANPSVVANSTVTVNSASLGATGSVLAEGSLDIPVTQSGSPVGSWNGSAWVIPPASICASISLAVSNTTPSFGQQITLTATATDFTGTITYFFLVRNSIGGWEKIQQSGNTYNWNASYAGTYMVHVIAEDTDGNSASSCVSITVGTLESKYSIDAAYGKTVTLVSDKVDVWSDITGNSHNATAPSATTRGYTTRWGGSSECVGVSTENDDRLITNLNMNTSEVTLYGVFDFNDNTIQGAFDVAGIISGDANITSCRYNATITDDSINPRTVNLQVRTSSGAFTITGNIVNGKVIFVFKYSSGTMRTIINGTTSSQSVTGTLVGTGTINYALLNVNTGGWGGACTFPVYSLGIKTTALSDSDQDQLYADLLIKYPS